MDIVVVAQAAAAAANNATLAQALTRHWKQLLRECVAL
jgi:RNase P protein component